MANNNNTLPFLRNNESIKLFWTEPACCGIFKMGTKFMPKSQGSIKKNNRPRILIAGLMGLVVGLGGISFLLSDGKRGNEAERKTTESGADFHMKKVTFHEFQRERPVWKMNAEEAQVFRENDIALLKDVRTTLYQENGQFITLTGKKAKIRLSSMDISIRGDILARSEDGTEVFAKSLHWDNKNRRVTSQDPIEIIRSNIQLKGIGMELDPDREVMTIKRRVQTLVEESPRG